MPILLGAVAYRTDLPKYEDYLDEWLDKSLKPDPPLIACPKCDVKYILIEPDVEPQSTVDGDAAFLAAELTRRHPDHSACIPFRADTDPNLEEQVRRINGNAPDEPTGVHPKSFEGAVPEIIQQPTDEIKYPSWQPLCRAVMIEIEPLKMKRLLAAAEAAMAERLKELTASPDCEAERRAMQQEGEAMRLAFAEVVSQHPDLHLS